MTYEHDAPHQWVDAKINLPEIGRTVLVFGKDGFNVARLDEIYDGEGFWLNSSYDYIHVRHWMELPEAPETFKGKCVDEFGYPIPRWIKWK